MSVLAQSGLSFDFSTASGKLMRIIMAGLAEFERDLSRMKPEPPNETARKPVLIDLAMQGGGSHGAFTWRASIASSRSRG